ncbi:cobalt ECF transporter T component CbiQ [uncultured Nocardioides sp.]|uniref:cobalt ECF transporter T component CbiQ n=1 Tax=uncultured Nocardioides sp. TaxID=198441 RepID=UPI00260B6D99|nr:cobalt ECF transporter T component CbiQ [uncultured Nocardioides sp.]
MSGAHSHLWHHHGHGPLHRAPAHLKLVALIGFMLAVVAIPRDALAWHAVPAAVVAVVVAVSGVPLRHLAPRMLVETPFVVFALLVPFVATGPRVDVLGVPLSEPGLVAAGAFLAKATIGVVASLTVASTTTAQQLVDGLTRLRVPALLVQITGFMLRYLEVVTGDMGRMTVAMRARGLEPRRPRHWPVLARSLGSLFIRSYERGERVHLAMLARGHTTGRTG